MTAVSKVFPWAAARWASLGAAPAGRRVPGSATVAGFALLVAIVAGWISYATGYNTAYSDALSHLTIARRLFDSKAPGFQQLGTVWLPIPHLLLAPFSASLWLWHTGLAGTVLGGLCLIAATVSLYRVMARLGARRAGRLLAVGVFVLNPTTAYIFTTALTEPVLIATLLMATAGIAGWALDDRPHSGGELAIWAGAPTAMAVMARYEGWALMIIGIIVVTVIVVRRDRAGPGLSSRSFWTVFGYAAPSLGVLCWWLAYNWALYRNPLEFAFGQYSAQAQANLTQAQGLLTTKGNLGLSLYTWGWSVLEFTGWVPLLIAALGAALVLVLFGIGDRGLIFLLMVVPGCFVLAGLYVGMNVITNDHSLPTGWWNDRFAVCSGIATAAFCGIAVGLVPQSRRWDIVARASAVVLGLAVLGQYAWFAQDMTERSAVVAEAKLTLVNGKDPWAAAYWLHAHYTGGGILIDESAGDNAVLPLIGVPMKQIYDRASGTPAFAAARARPQTHVEWIFMHITPPSHKKLTVGVDDYVSAAMAKDPAFFEHYRLAFASGDIGVYQRTGF